MQVNFEIKQRERMNEEKFSYWTNRIDPILQWQKEDVVFKEKKKKTTVQD